MPPTCLREPSSATWVAPANSRGLALVVEDDPGALKFIELTLRKAGFTVLTAASAEEALQHFAQRQPRIALVDLGLPGMDGFELCQLLRFQCEGLGIVILTGRDEDSARVLGLDQGADDYVLKPFSPDVLMAHINAVLRRCVRQADSATSLTLGDLKVDFQSMKATKAGQEVDLTPREFALLVTFLRHPGQVLSREQLRTMVWGENHFGSTKSLDVFVCKLREKLEDDPAHPQHFKTARGVGFICD